MPFDFFGSQCANVIKDRLGDFPRGVEKAVRGPQTQNPLFQKTAIVLVDSESEAFELKQTLPMPKDRAGGYQ